MPFTLSHPAAVICLARRPLVPSALVMGSMAPDMSYLLFWMGLGRWRTHDWLGAVTVDVALALGMLAVFHLLLKWPLIALCPEGWRSRLSRPAGAFEHRSMGDLGVLLVSAAVGAATHVGWDTISHGDALWHHSRLLGRVVQYGSGALGLGVVCWWVARWYARTEPVPAHLRQVDPLTRAARRWIVLGVGAAAVAGSAIGAATWARQDVTPAGAHERATGLLVGASGAVLVALLVYGLCWRLNESLPWRAEGRAGRRPRWPARGRLRRDAARRRLRRDAGRRPRWRVAETSRAAETSSSQGRAWPSDQGAAHGTGEAS